MDPLDVTATVLAVLTVGLAAFLVAGPWPPAGRTDDPDLRVGGAFLDPRVVMCAVAAFFVWLALRTDLVEPFGGRLALVVLAPALVGVLARRLRERQGTGRATA